MNFYLIYRALKSFIIFIKKPLLLKRLKIGWRTLCLVSEGVFKPISKIKSLLLTQPTLVLFVIE